MVRLSRQDGVVVNVDPETADRLKAEGGWSAADDSGELKKAPAKRSTSSKSNS